MIKIALLGNVEKRKQMESVLSQCLDEKNVICKIYHSSNSLQFMKDYYYNSDIRLCLLCYEGTITYIIKVYTNFNPKLSHCSRGTLKFPLTHENVNMHLLRKLLLPKVCPYGAYTVKRRKTTRRILHENIEYINREKNISIIHLNDGDKETTSKSTALIAKELNKKYFARCGKGYVVNIFNIDRISDDFKIITLKSGAKIPMTRSGKKEFLKSLSLTITGINIFNY